MASEFQSQAPRLASGAMVREQCNLRLTNNLRLRDACRGAGQMLSERHGRVLVTLPERNADIGPIWPRGANHEWGQSNSA